MSKSVGIRNMLKGCTKFRLFSLLVFFGVVNILIFRSYFRKELDLLLNSRGYDVNVTSSWDGANDINATSASQYRIVPTQLAEWSANTTAADGNATHEGSGSKWGEGRVLETWGKAVWPRANITALWASGNDSSLPLCPLIPPKLVGPLATYKDAPSLAEIVKLNPGLELGGHYQPAECRARHRVAIVVPYRDRETHLRILLHNLHPMLIRQQLDYFILVVEQALPTKFNRGLLLNIGFVEALGLRDVQCFVLHDVDLVPENDRNLYTCPESPRHMSAAIDKFQYKLPYSGILGGVVAISKEHFYKVNGYSNIYFGWGGEDDDLYERVKAAGLKVSRYSMDVARYHMIKHDRDKNNEPNPERFDMLKNFKQRQPQDGLNSLQYRVEQVEFRPAYTWIMVSVDQNQISKS